MGRLADLLAAILREVLVVRVALGALRLVVPLEALVVEVLRTVPAVRVAREAFLQGELEGWPPASSPPWASLRSSLRLA